MGNLVVKHNVLIESSHSLSEVAQRLILLAIVKGRRDCDKIEDLQGKDLVIHIREYEEIYGVGKDASYKALKQAVMSLYRAEWGYKYLTEKGEERVRYERFTQSADYGKGEGTVIFRFADAIIPYLVELERNYTSYDIEQVARLSSRYAMRLYEFFVRFLDRETGKGWLNISIDDLRFRLGLLPTEYERTNNFKQKVLDLAIKQINNNTDLSVTYEQQKQGRTIVGFKFKFKYNAKNIPKITPNQTKKSTSADIDRDDRTIDIFDNLTDKERKIVEQKREYARQRGIDDPAHIHNLIAQGLNRHRQAEQHEQALEDRKKAERQAEQAQKQAEQKAERVKKQQQAQAIDEMVAKYERLSHEQQQAVLDKVQAIVGQKAVFMLSLFEQNRKTDSAHRMPQFQAYFAEVLAELDTAPTPPPTPTNLQQKPIEEPIITKTAKINSPYQSYANYSVNLSIKIPYDKHNENFYSTVQPMTKKEQDDINEKQYKNTTKKSNKTNTETTTSKKKNKAIDTTLIDDEMPF